MSEYLFTRDLSGGFSRELSDNAGNKYIIPLPNPPEEKYIINYELPSAKQYFKKEEIPKNLRRLPFPDQERIIRALWHKRLHGEYQFINGRLVYFEGQNWRFLNFWNTARGGLPEFRSYQTDAYQLWGFARRDVKCLGVAWWKARQRGFTELKLDCFQEKASRTKNGKIGFMNMTDDDAKSDFQRIAVANHKMPFYFKPKHKGNAIPQGDILHYLDASEKMTKAKIQEEFGAFSEDIDNEDIGLNTYIKYEATVEGKFDGQTLVLYGLGEFGKIPPSKLNILKQWNRMKPFLMGGTGTSAKGKAFFESTCEPVDEDKMTGESEAIRRAEELWNQSNPEERDENGFTLSGLYRFFFNAIDTWDADEYGFPKKEEGKQFLQQRFKKLAEQGFTETLSAERRMNPITIADVFQVSSSQNPFDQAIINRRINQVNNNLDYRDRAYDENGKEIKSQGRRGRLEWVNGIKDGTVMFVDDPRGHWFFSQMPQNPNARVTRSGKWCPANEEDGIIGIDSIDAGAEVIGSRASKAAISIKRRLNTSKEPQSAFDADGNLINGANQTGKFIGKYLHRPLDPEEFYEQTILGMVFCGYRIFPEQNKSRSLENYIIKRNYDGYFAYMGTEMRTGLNQKIIRPGAPATPQNIDTGILLLGAHISKYGLSEDDPDRLRQWQKFTRDVRTYYDLTVADYFCLLGEQRRTIKKEEPIGDTIEKWFRMASIPA